MSENKRDFPARTTGRKTPTRSTSAQNRSHFCRMIYGMFMFHWPRN